MGNPQVAGIGVGGAAMTTSHDDLQRSLGRVEGNQDAMETRMDRFESALSEGFKDVKAAISEMRGDFDKRLAAIEERESERRGAWKTILAGCAAVSALAAFLVEHFFGK